MAPRRPMGALQSAVLRALWSAGAEGATPGDVRSALGDAVSYTTITTILSRLFAKGVLQREKRGRSFVYVATAPDAELAARGMRDALDRTDDREAALSRFVGKLSRKEERAIRKLLDCGDG